jgi:hypothetical protein
MKKRSASSRSAARATTKKRSTLTRGSGGAKRAMITAEEFDRLADLPVDDPAGDMTPYLDLSTARRPGREVQRVNVDFPIDLLRAIDREARRIGVTRQAFIKLRLSDTLVNT